MVSKIAVMALVAVVAVPILLGYGLNIQTNTYSEWETDGNPADVSDYLLDTYDTTNATFLDADIYQMNANNFYRSNLFNTYPDYVSTTSAYSPIVLNQNTESYSTTKTISSSYTYYQCIVNGTFDSTNYYDMELYQTGGGFHSSSHIKYFSWNWNGETATVQYNIVSGADNISQTVTVQNVITANLIPHGTASVQAQWINANGTNDYVDLTKGYYLNKDYYDTKLEYNSIVRSMIITFDLNTILDDDYVLSINVAAPGWAIDDHADKNNFNVSLKKHTFDGTVNWYFDKGSAGYQNRIYYNDSASSNTYQLYLNGTESAELRFIGAWPSEIAPAPAIVTYTLEDTYIQGPTDRIGFVEFKNDTPLMRIDNVRVAGFNYQIMQDATYEPSAFKANPHTTLSNMVRYGSSIQFGGVTYAVDKGNITLGARQFSLNGMVFESTPSNGQYENKINDYVVSTTPEPSAIVFNGKWLIDVKTDSQSLIEKSETKWMPGEFAWNGIDDNFLIAGLMASLGAFIALAIYGRRSGAKVLPLLLVCGGAAFMFLLMI